MRPVPQSGRANPAAIAARVRSQMAPQRLEKIKSAPGNGMAPETPDPNIWYKRAIGGLAEPTRVSVSRNECYAREGDGNFPGCKALKSHEMRKGSHPSRLMELRIREAGGEDSSASPRLRGNRRPRASKSEAPRGPRRPPANADAAEGEENYPGCKALKNHKTGKYGHTPTAKTTAPQVHNAANHFHPRWRAAALPC